MSTTQGTRYVKSPAGLSDVRTPTPSPPHTTPQPQVSTDKGMLVSVEISIGQAESVDIG